MKNNTARSRTRWAAQAGGLFCFTVLLSLSSPLGFVGLSCRAGKLFIQTTAPTTPSVSICGSRLLCSSGWEVVNSSSSPSRPPVRQDMKRGAAGCATDAAIHSTLGETCRPVRMTNPCPIDEKVPSYLPEQLCFICRCLQVHLGCWLCWKCCCVVLARCEACGITCS